MFNFFKTKNLSLDIFKSYLIGTILADIDNEDYYKKYYPELKKQKIGDELCDVICDRSVTDPVYSTNIDQYTGMFNQMNWGYQGIGPQTLAVNTLYLFTNGDLKFAREFYNDFVRDFLLSKKQTENLTIRKEKIISWIELKRKGLRLIEGGKLV